MPVVSDRVLLKTPNAEAAIKLANWARTADYDSVVKAYTDRRS